LAYSLLALIGLNLAMTWLKTHQIGKYKGLLAFYHQSIGLIEQAKTISRYCPFNIFLEIIIVIGVLVYIVFWSLRHLWAFYRT